ncbi:molybdopterin-guanine dinucleotide biosynthesis protein B [Ectothiorhodospira mobilis]|uniref:molybdopterin-guanine dinucleotide biosynthesis protein B n=1 Tax=Ectothiorhodospira mobilis TaxID=195064 RepID=UPI0019069360|nr:molybdopterin-guanine dinucleotide biosynthesis protein B [Ectothiorhodospira mobilis]MBK1690883.1 molybdopterin-guanine dinucleotide biosynthesis protein B [Ectothiorhodospira mobilis]
MTIPHAEKCTPHGHDHGHDGIPPVLGLAAWSGTGKTTLLATLIPLLRARGLRPALIKHAHHRFDVDHPGKDSHTLREAGAEQVLVASRHRMALMVESPEPREPRLEELLRHLDPRRTDLVLVEGFREAPGLPKIELHRAALDRPLLHPGDPYFIAVASDTPGALKTSLPVLDLNAPPAIAGFILDWLRG